MAAKKKTRKKTVVVKEEEAKHKIAYEYMVVEIPAGDLQTIQDQINGYGADGWYLLFTNPTAVSVPGTPNVIRTWFVREI